VGLRNGESQSAIARRLGRDKSVICRELKRNSSPVYGCYSGVQAQRRAEERLRESHVRMRIADERVRAYIERRLSQDAWTPERIAGRLPLDEPGLSVSYETIYQWIYAERRDLVKYLVCGHRERRKRANAHKSRVGRIPNRRDITERPAVVEAREEAGHWEADTVVSRQSKEAVAVFVERKSRYYIAIKIKDKSAEEMLRAAILALAVFPRALLKTITFDNGLENALHGKIDAALGTTSYFCKPYHSWEKGSIENRNGILRRFFAKKLDWGLTKKSECDSVLRKINAMPMKCLGFRTPYEVLNRYAGVALAG
jgi:IS30 family transposase